MVASSNEIMFPAPLNMTASLQEMLLAIVDNSGPGFRGSEKFILAVRHYLCEALLLNSTSSNKEVMKLSLKIFKPMCRDFKVGFGLLSCLGLKCRGARSCHCSLAVL